MNFLPTTLKRKKISIHWQKSDIKFNPYKRWLELWEEDNET
ncbi:ThaI family type II restriction endonuclease [bacterium]|nr:ThaI family type II restriction endonuclease [bacterium]